MKRKAIVKQIENSPGINLTDWSLKATEEYRKEIEATILEAAAEALTLSLKDKIWAFFPEEWNFGDNPSDGCGNKPITDTSTIYIQLPLGPEENEPIFAVSLSEIVDLAIGGLTGSDDNTEEQKPLVTIRDMLKGLADRIDQVISPQFR